MRCVLGIITKNARRRAKNLRTFFSVLFIEAPSNPENELEVRVLEELSSSGTVTNRV